MRKMFFKSFIMLLVLTMIMVPGVSARTDSGEMVDIIVLTSGTTDALVGRINALGGVVNYQYRNVDAVSASIPVEALGQISVFAGVTSVQKDVMVYLPEDINGNDERPMSFVVEGLDSADIQILDPNMIELGDLPEGYANFMYTGAASVWEETMYGEGTIVAVVDTGTTPNDCLDHAVIGAPGFPDGYAAIEAHIPATSPYNHYHGTHVGGVIASNCAFNFSGTMLGEAIETHLDISSSFVPVLGQAPFAELYPVKVFPSSGAGVPSSVVLDGLDHVLTLKKDGQLDIDIVNMSLGGATFWDGRDAYDRFMEELVNANILVVTSAGNSGPIPNSIGSPATSFGTVSVGALDYAPSSRVLYEYLGLFDLGASGQGMVMRPTEETRVANFSSRGPLSDGRFGPEISALGLWNFHMSNAIDEDGNPIQILRWAGGTSFSAPTVAGAAALLNAWWEAQGNETDPGILENVLYLGADPHVVGASWQGVTDQGYGALDVAASLDYLMSGNWKFKPARDPGRLTANVLGRAVPGRVQTWESKEIELTASESFDAVFEITDRTSKVVIEIYDIVAPNNSAYAFWPNALEVHLQSAKRTTFSHPIVRYWYPYFFGDTLVITVEDGEWTSPWGIETYQPMEPGLMKLSLIGDYSNEDPVNFKVRITRENYKERLPVRNQVANGVIKMADSHFVEVEIPEGITTATFDLIWGRDWSSFPTSDVDMYIFDPDFNLVSLEGATANAPERAIIEAPIAGTWTVLVYGYEVNRSDNYNLFLTLE